MRIVRIQHEQCNEPNGSTVVLAPPDWTKAQIQEKVSEAKREHIEASKKLQADEKHEFKHLAYYSGGPTIKYEDHPTKTVKEVQELHKQTKERWKKWYAQHNENRRSFKNRLIEKGFIEVWDDEVEAVDVVADWGHNHGLKLDYWQKDDDF
jgi:DNA repair exonuclease SbcCD ATPase subunit